MLKVVEFTLQDKTLIKEFVEFPYRLYDGCEQWIPKLKMDYLGSKLLGKVGMFQKNFSYHEQAETVFLMVKDNQDVLACMTVSINHAYNRFQQEKVGFFGFFEAINDTKVVAMLFERARQWLFAQGCNKFIGPYNFTYNHVCGVLVHGFEHPATLETSYNFEYYDDLLNSVDMRKAKDLLSFAVPVIHEKRDRRLAKVAQRIFRNQKISIRQCSLKHFKRDIRTFVKIYNQAWEDLWSFVPLTEAEADIIAESIKPIIVPEVFLFAEKDGEVVGVSGVIPDANQVLSLGKSKFAKFDLVRVFNLLVNKRSIDGVRLMVFGIKKEMRRSGLEAALLAKTIERTAKYGFKRSEVGWVHEDNHLILGSIENSKGEHYRTHRIYEGHCSK